MNIYIVGAGPGNPDLLTAAARRAVEESTVLIGSRRIIEPYAKAGKLVYETYKPSAIRHIAEEIGEGGGSAAVLVSGDVGFYSLAQSLKFPETCKVVLYPGISSLAYFAAKLGISWHDVHIVSRHGRYESLAAAVSAHRKVFCLTGGEDTVSSLCGELCRAGLGNVRIDVGSRLSYDDERIVSGTAEAVSDLEIDALAVMMIYNDNPCRIFGTVHGLPDELFIRGAVPMTKQAVRSAAISLLRPGRSDCVYDIGAGTGSCAVELSLQVPFGHVYAFECNKEAINVLQKNKEKFGAENMTIVYGDAAAAMREQPVPHCAFIGGTKGRLEDILDQIYEKNKYCRVVLTSVTLETLAAATLYYQKRQEYSVSVTQIQAAVSKKIASHHLMNGQNPVHIITAQYHKFQGDAV